jgi:hypothetical protein
MTTVVRIPHDQWVQYANELSCNMSALAVFRKHGIPVLGGLSIRGVEHGRLTMERIGDEHVFTWEPGKKAPQRKEEEW